MKSKVSVNSIIRVAKDQVSADLAEEAVILNLKKGVYYGLNSVGARIWQIIQEPKKVSEIRNILLSEYEVEPDRCEQDLITLFQELADEGLIEFN